VYVHFHGLWPTRRIALEDIAGYEARRYTMWESGGWGVHLRMSGMAYKVSGNDGVSVTLRNGRKVLVNKLLQGLGVFRFVSQILGEAAEKRLPADIVQEELAIRLPTEDTELLFTTLVAWGRFAELFRYENAVLSLDS
jgi:hypothetical protein